MTTRRDFLAAGAAFAAGTALTARGARAADGAAPASAFSLPPLPYPPEALEPHIDAQTMNIHHGKHHAAYVKNLNAAIEKHPELGAKSIEEILKDTSAIPEDIRQAVINNGGGHANHSLFWQTMRPAPASGANAPKGKIGDAINGAFGDFAKFQEAFADAGMKRFGSGWAWLVVGKDGKLAITSSANQDSPISKGEKPLLGCDVWEHAYYLKYQNLRADYIKAWWNVVNWDKVGMPI